MKMERGLFVQGFVIINKKNWLKKYDASDAMYVQ